ncbi:hypothetical protein SNOG_12687 [Parastagonospora nodorum SN15]|uniref:GPR1/FUN34/YaaH-class plasma membrane protein n=1 Tax=Phaeosphaeria nodorum (strain SN15 / ATCC MYA-4574 / FGSC 10173) TaxID=321614 RepID=Q0U6C7_PHANO|nr:hypothetical protein SNOG_12687 [Parastagonospora nodorum SN15]EAT79985.2 hypothetical protein SNOG_12687 [Parastagonospora nodorum SN15]
MTTHHETTTTTSNSTGSGLFNNHGAGFPQDTASNNAHLGATSGRETNNTHLGASSAREGDTLSAGSTANGSFSRMANHNNELEKDFSRQDAGSISISPELFEKLYLSPPNKVKGELRKTFANEDSALIGFLLSLFPLSMTLMGWRGAGGNGAASTGWYFFAGGMLMVLGGVGEWILGNTFPFVVFCSFGAFWLGYGATLQPFYNSYAAYKNPQVETSTGIESVGFNVGVAYFMIAMGILCFIYLICSIRTNLIFFLIFFTLVPAFGLLAGAFLHAAKGNAAIASKCQEAAGAFTFVTCMCGWYILLAIMLASVDFPFDLPLVDLSGVIKGASEKRKIDHIE